MSSEGNRENMEKSEPENPTVLTLEKMEKLEISPGAIDNQEVVCESADTNKATQSQSCEINTGIVVKTMESESLNSLLVYESDDSSTSSEMIDFNWQVRNESEDSSSSSSSSSDDDEDSDSSSEDDDGDCIESPPVDKGTGGAVRKSNPVKNDGDMSVDQLPPVPDLSKLQISIEDENFVHMGNVLGIVDKLVTVAAIPNTPAYDLDTLLFLDNGKRPLGFVFDVLGQVTSPIYAIRFNAVEDIKNLGIEIGAKVYSAPTSKHTQYVFLQELLKMKGTDASWKDDTEVPAEFADFSDDETECFHRFGNRKLTPHVKRTHSNESYKKFESTMNRRNILNTKLNKYMDSYKQARFSKAEKRPQASQIAAAVPMFDPSVPPPNLAQYMTTYYYQAGSSDYPAGIVYDPGSNNNFFMNNFLNQTNSASYYSSHPGPSHQ